MSTTARGATVAGLGALALAVAACTRHADGPPAQIRATVVPTASEAVLDEIAIVPNPGAESRRPEAAHIAPVLADYRRVTFIREPGTLDGGDVLRLGRRIFVGRSGRSDERGIEQLRAVVWPYGYTVTSVPVGGCLHLKSAITEVAPGTVLVKRAWVEPAVFDHPRIIDVDPPLPPRTITVSWHSERRPSALIDAFVGATLDVCAAVAEGLAAELSDLPQSAQQLCEGFLKSD